ncbi:MAG: hypothetical protein ABS43_25505 [Bordetella sp. SCN 67-23]|nr:tetratricopeptide repeat protein [Burkholderiales bacterium]ODS69520.1 MAG: hypothetical protein ABS43_25505 [Bordetella sp. SCN 67-23]ODU78055.1 MAG: hypothetical protein ABT00_13760 [Bordetella sp. SCN 68-11]OJW90939.1 MAG: hypothetical protein BGO71_02430 [Burkholderiales bacterium 67-32]
MTGSIHFPARMAGLLGVALLAAGCSSTAPSGYGVSAPKFNDEAMMRQQVANDEPTADSRGMYLSLIREMQGKGLYFASLAHIDAFEQRHGAAPDVELLRAHALREAGQSEESAVVYRRLLKTEVGAAAAQGLGLLAGARGDYPAAVVSLREAARLDPTNALIVSDLGYALLRNGETAAARLPMAQAAELAPENSRILANLALLMLVSGDAGRAGTVMDKAGLSPDARVAVRKLADDIARRAPQASRPVAVVKADPAPAAIPVPPPAASPFPVSSLAPEMSRVPMAPGVERATVMPRTAVVRTAAQESEPTDTVREPAVRQVSAPVLQPVRAPMQSMLDRFNSAIP